MKPIIILGGITILITTVDCASKCVDEGTKKADEELKPFTDEVTGRHLSFTLVFFTF